MALLNAILLWMFQNKMKYLQPLKSRRNLQIFKKMCFICNDKSILMTMIRMIRAELDGAKWIVPRAVKLSGVNIMKVTRAVGFMKPCLGLIFFVIDNRLSFLLSKYNIISLVIYNTLLLLSLKIR